MSVTIRPDEAHLGYAPERYSDEREAPAWPAWDEVEDEGEC